MTVILPTINSQVFIEGIIKTLKQLQFYFYCIGVSWMVIILYLKIWEEQFIIELTVHRWRIHKNYKRLDSLLDLFYS